MVALTDHQGAAIQCLCLYCVTEKQTVILYRTNQIRCTNVVLPGLMCACVLPVVSIAFSSAFCFYLRVHNQIVVLQIKSIASSWPEICYRPPRQCFEPCTECTRTLKRSHTEKRRKQYCDPAVMCGRSRVRRTSWSSSSSPSLSCFFPLHHPFLSYSIVIMIITVCFCSTLAQKRQCVCTQKLPHKWKTKRIESRGTLLHMQTPQCSDKARSHTHTHTLSTNEGCSLAEGRSRIPSLIDYSLRQ